MDSSQLDLHASNISSPDTQDIIVSGGQGIISSASSLNDSSIFSMFWNAGLMIKVVMLTLLIASILSWTIMISKHLKLKRLNLDADIFEDNFWSGIALETLYKEIKESGFDPISNIFCAAMAEWKRYTSSYKDSLSAKSLEQRVERAMQIAMRKEIDDLEKNMNFLSSLGTNGVIIGIFGTVLGIMGGFKTIALQQSSSITTVAPVIAEALFTTALGLIAAIPAAIGYNILMGNTNRYISRLETFCDEFSSIITRQIDERN
ncbi:MAG: protein TolQ [Holosporales bacterium]|jgi:biopolymer transport protein TolQ|nr:protein TolQ [Holosporales bacterium]